ncbi:MAG: S-adenosylmethionine:tRNA ribosyltransferase-isomerase [Bacteroidota bacterium]|nr:S-adenosylmethionine:tRNA ribosyltransferase-isomerase [Bacteroidota bacterium]
MHPKDLSIKEFSYELPDEKIAKYPLAERDQSKLLIYKEGKIEEDTYEHLDQFLPENTLLIFNNTKVVEARLIFQKSTGGLIEIFCLEPADLYPDITTAMLQKGKVLWNCLVGGAKKWKEELVTKQIEIRSKHVTITARRTEKTGDTFLIAFEWNDHSISFAELLHAAGSIPLPPYLNRATEESDKETYQTVYAKHDGSVAAPTAGLHFTEKIFSRLAEKNIQHTFVTLHVGAGTFKPVKSEILKDHEMHAEFIDVSVDLVEQLSKASNKTIVSVGTTSLRTIESLYWMGVKVITKRKETNHLNIEAISVSQWDAYELQDHLHFTEAFAALLQWMQEKEMTRIITKTRIIIAPGYSLKVADGIITNFHQPQSTLLLLIASVIGNDWKKVYDYALNHSFRFLSYGDGSLLWKTKTPN